MEVLHYWAIVRKWFWVMVLATTLVSQSML